VYEISVGIPNNLLQNGRQTLEGGNNEFTFHPILLSQDINQNTEDAEKLNPLELLLGERAAECGLQATPLKWRMSLPRGSAVSRASWGSQHWCEDREANDDLVTRGNPTFSFCVRAEAKKKGGGGFGGGSRRVTAAMHQKEDPWSMLREANFLTTALKGGVGNIKKVGRDANEKEKAF